MAKIIRKFIRRAREFRALRNEANDAFAAYADGADTEYTLRCLASIGRRMSALRS